MERSRAGVPFQIQEYLGPVLVLGEVARGLAEGRLREVVRVLLEPQARSEAPPGHLDHHVVVAREELVEGLDVARLRQNDEPLDLVVLHLRGQHVA